MLRSTGLILLLCVSFCYTQQNAGNLDDLINSLFTTPPPGTEVINGGQKPGGTTGGTNTGPNPVVPNPTEPEPLPPGVPEEDVSIYMCIYI